MNIELFREFLFAAYFVWCILLNNLLTAMFPVHKLDAKAGGWADVFFRIQVKVLVMRRALLRERDSALEIRKSKPDGSRFAQIRIIVRKGVCVRKIGR